MAKRKSPQRTPKLSSSQIGRLRDLLEKAVLDAAFRRRLLANPGQVLAQHRIGLSPAQLRQFDKARKMLIKKAREIEKNARAAAQRLAKQARILGMPVMR